jgi:hypothetical protein
MGEGKGGEAGLVGVVRVGGCFRSARTTAALGQNPFTFAISGVRFYTNVPFGSVPQPRRSATWSAFHLGDLRSDSLVGSEDPTTARLDRALAYANNERTYRL